MKGGINVLKQRGQPTLQGHHYLRPALAFIHIVQLCSVTEECCTLNPWRCFSAEDTAELCQALLPDDFIQLMHDLDHEMW